MKQKSFHNIQQQIVIIIISFAFLSIISCNSGKEDNVPILDLEKASDGLIELDNRFHNYSDAECLFLKGSSSFHQDDIRSAYCSGNDLFLLLPQKFLHYNLISGDLVFEYKPTEPANFRGFVYDRPSNNAYILDNKVPQILELDMNGEITKKVKLDAAHVYPTINRISGQRFLLSRQTVPYPSFDIVDFETGNIQEYLVNPKKKTKPIPESSDTIWQKYPLYVTDEAPGGILVKYLFDERVYRFTDNRLTTNYAMKMGNQKVKLKYPWSSAELKSNDRLRVIRFWQSNKRTYILYQEVVENVLDTFDANGLSQFVDFKAVEPFCNFLCFVNLASLGRSSEVFMDNRRNRFLSIRKLQEEEMKDQKKWPKHMLEASNKEDLVVSIFTMKQ